MIRLEIISGKMAGSQVVVRRFPFHIGRGSQAGLQIDEPGVWENHLEIHLHRGDGYYAVPQGDALVAINGDRDTPGRLHTGDVIELGAARIRFWLGETTQHRFGVREAAAWVLVIGMVMAEIALIYAFL